MTRQVHDEQNAGLDRLRDGEPSFADEDDEAHALSVNQPMMPISTEPRHYVLNPFIGPCRFL